MKYPEIDYSVHPAYAPYAERVRYDHALISTLIVEADRAHAKFCVLDHPTEVDARDTLADIRHRLNQIRTHATQQNISIIAEEWLDSTIKWGLADFGQEYALRILSSQEYRPQSFSGVRAQQLAMLHVQGMYITELPAEVYDDIRRLALQHRDKLRQRALSDQFNRAVTNVPFNSSLWRAIKRGAKEAGIFDVLSEFERNRMTMLGAGLEYSCSEQNWYQHLYADAGVADSPLQYLHVDEGASLPKSMIYVTAVEEQNGPTRAIPGSNTWERSECQVRVHKALDRVVGNRYAGFVRQAHYRPLARHAELRQIFMELPGQFQGSSHFGDDIIAGTPLAANLAGAEVAYLSPGAQALVFDGGRLLHRGSLVRSGERMALQVIYRSQNSERAKSSLGNESFLREQAALVRKYMRKFVMGMI